MELLRGPGRKVSGKNVALRTNASYSGWVGLIRNFNCHALFFSVGASSVAATITGLDTLRRWLCCFQQQRYIVRPSRILFHCTINLIFCSYRNSTAYIPQRAELFWFPHWCVLITGPFVFICSLLHLLIGKWFTGILVSFRLHFITLPCNLPIFLLSLAKLILMWYLLQH